MARVNAQVVTYFHMEPETLHDVITTAQHNAERLEREAEDLKQQASEKIKAATYILMEPETLHDIITTADAKYQRLRREAEDLQMKASAKTRAAKETHIMLQAAIKAQEQQMRRQN